MPLKTEYQLHYGTDKEEDENENYLTRLSFRKDRMSSERRHTPLIWIDLEEYHKEKKQVDVLLNADPDPKLESSIKETEHIAVSVERENDTVFIEKKVVKEIPSAEKEQPLETMCILKKEKKKSVLKPLNKKIMIEHDKPIIAYGWADKTSLDAKKTFNIKAPKTEVRMSALRAATQRDLQRRKRLTSKEKIQKEKSKHQEIIDHLTNFNQWETEYKRQFDLR